MTCVIGARCNNGCAIISDVRETTGTENRDVNKIRVLWNNKGAMAGAGDVPIISKVAETINRMSKNPHSDIVKDIDNNVRTVIQENQSMTLEAMFMGLQEFGSGDPYIRLIDRRGFSTLIENFSIIGRGARYAEVLFKMFYDKNLNVNELAVLGYFCIGTLVSLELDDSVGISKLGPEAVVLTANGLTRLNWDHMHPDFETAYRSYKSRRFRNKLMRSIWNRVPEAFQATMASS